MIIMNEKIKAKEVELKGVNGEELGIVATADALRMAKEQKVDLVCLSLMSSPPPCQLISRSEHKAVKSKEKQQERKATVGAKLKEVRMNADIEAHDYDTKKRQAERILAAGHDVQLTILVENKKSEPAKKLALELIRDLAAAGTQDKGIQVSGKQVIAIIRAKA